jgi:hypothetical protein
MHYIEKSGIHYRPNAFLHANNSTNNNKSTLRSFIYVLLRGNTTNAVPSSTILAILMMGGFLQQAHGVTSLGTAFLNIDIRLIEIMIIITAHNFSEADYPCVFTFSSFSSLRKA